MIRILCIETSADTCSVALSENGLCKAELEAIEERAHAKLLTVLVQQLLLNSNLKISDIHAIAISEGPGSYTGLRIGMSVAKGICFGADLPLISIPTLQTIVSAYIQKKGSIPKNATLMPMIDARRMEIYYATYNSNLEELSPATPYILDDQSFSEIKNSASIFMIGNGAEKCRELLQDSNITFDNHVIAHAKNMTTEAHNKFTKKEFVNTAYFEPAYLKPFIATISKKNILHS